MRNAALDKPWTLARWNPQQGRWQVVARFRTHAAALAHSYIYQRWILRSQKPSFTLAPIDGGCMPGTSIWYERLDLQWFEDEINRVEREQCYQALTIEAIRTGIEPDLAIEECCQEIESLQRQKVKLFEAVDYLARARNWELHICWLNGRVTLSVFESRQPLQPEGVLCTGAIER